MMKKLSWSLMLAACLWQADVLASNPLQQAAEQGQAKAQLEYGRSLQESSPLEARMWIQRAADQGYAEAWYWLGYSYSDDEQTSLQYYEKAVSYGFQPALETLLDRLLFSAGERANVARAKKVADLARQHAAWQKDSELMRELRAVDRCAEAGELPPLPDLAPAQIELYRGKTCRDYRVKNPPDWNAYKSCVMAQAEPEFNDLAEIYANGWGVTRDSKSATAWICRASNTPMELMSMVEALSSLQPNAEFRFCDYVQYGMSANYCSAETILRAQEKLEQQWTQFIQQANETEKPLLLKLRQTADAFFGAQAALDASKPDVLQQQLLQQLQSMQFSPTTIHEKDLVQQLRSIKGPHKQAIQHSQQLWERYRDAWAAWMKQKSPNATDWRAWLIGQRVEQLRNLKP